MNSIILFPWAVDYFGAEAVKEAQEHPAIRHFEGPGANKPWHLLCKPDEHLLYMSHRSQTPWPKLRRSGRTPGNLLRYARQRNRAV